MMQSFPTTVLSKVASLGLGAKLGVVGLTMAAGLALTLAGAEASGDPYGDAPGVESGAVANEGSATGVADGTSAQVGSDGSGGVLIVAFTDNVAYDGAGADIRVHTAEGEAPAKAKIEASADGVNFEDAGDFWDDAGPIDINLEDLNLEFATTVRITYVEGDEPGFDVDAVEALNQVGLGADLELTPAADASSGFDEHVVTANVSDDDLPAVGIQVTFLIESGPSEGDGDTTTTDGLGDATFGWTAPTGGSDTLLAFLDIDGSGTVDEGEPSGNATKLWYGDTGSIELNDLNGGDLGTGDLVEVVVEDLDLDTTDDPDVATIHIWSSNSDSTGIDVLLSETGDHTGVFSGVVTLGETTDALSDTLAAAVGDVITASYDDDLDSAGENPPAVTDSLDVTVEGEASLEALAEDEEQKVDVCHIPPGNPGNYRTLSIGEPALEAHLAHGDIEGDCADAEGLDELTSKQEQAQERKADRDEAFCERKGDDHPRCRADGEGDSGE